MISIGAYCALLFAFAMCAFSFYRIYDKYIELQNENIQLRQSIKELKDFLEKINERQE